MGKIILLLLPSKICQNGFKNLFKSRTNYVVTHLTIKTIVKTLENPAAVPVRAVSEEPRRHRASTPSADPDWLLITSRRFPLAAACPLNPLLYLCQFLALPLKAAPWLVVPPVVGLRVRRAAAARRSRTDENRAPCTSPLFPVRELTRKKCPGGAEEDGRESEQEAVTPVSP